MNASNARKETNASKPLFSPLPSSFRRLCRAPGLFFALALGVAAGFIAPAQAGEGSAPGMSGVTQIILQYANLGSQANAKSCGMPAGEIDTLLLKAFKNTGAPVVAALKAPPAEIGEARINLVPEVISISNQGTECTSWLALTAQTRNTVRVPPIDTPRTVIVTYWRGGLLVNSNEVSQARALSEGLTKLAEAFAKQYRIDQPPPLPDFTQPEKDSLTNQ